MKNLWTNKIFWEIIGYLTLALKLPPANIVRDIAFTGITIGLIVIYIW